MNSRPAIRTVVFDVGETLVDETRLWQSWADWLGIPRFTLLAVVGAVIERGEHHRTAFDILRPDLDLASARRQRLEQDGPPRLSRDDFYPDALPCLQRLKQRGLRVGLAGNQPADTHQALRDFGVDVDFMVMSAELGFEKPDPRFFHAVAGRAVASDNQTIAYVGDRLDNDVVPAMRAGMLGVFVRRGPWAFIQASQPDRAVADIEITGLDELPARLS